LFPFGTIVNFFIHRFANLSAGEPAKMCQTRKMRFHHCRDVAGIVGKNLQVLQQICSGLCPFEATGFPKTF